MTLEDVMKLVDSNTATYRRDNQYELPAGKLRSIVEVAYLAGEANHRNDVSNPRPSKTPRPTYSPRYAESV